MDALAGLLRDVRSDGAIFDRTIAAPPWSVRFAGSAPLTLITMLRGDAWIRPDDAEAARVAEGEVAIVSGTAPYSIADAPDSTEPPLYTMFAPGRCSGEISEIELGSRTYGSDPNAPIALLTGSYQVHGRVSDRLLSALPRVLVVPHGGDLCPLLELTEAEISKNQPGQQAVLDRLLDLLLLTAMREWFARPEACPPAWYRALGDPVVGPALRLIHDQPGHRWTIAALAERSNVSRATFARRFTDLVGEPAMAYLTGWRLAVASDLLARTDATVEAVARQVGYSNGFALSVALKRVYGMRPQDLRLAN